MKIMILVFSFLSLCSYATEQTSYVSKTDQINLAAAKELGNRIQKASEAQGKSVTIAVVGLQGETILIYRGDGVGPHNTEAARRKAFTSLSTKSSTLLLAQNARSRPETQNLANLPELLLLGGGRPLWREGKVIGAVGVAGGGGPENDDSLASKAILPEAGISTGK